MGYTDSDGAHLDSADIERARKCSTGQSCGTLLEGSPCPEHEAQCSFCGRVDLREEMIDLKAGEWACDLAECKQDNPMSDKHLPIKLTIRKSEGLDDWWVIERAEHDGRAWMERTGPNSMALRCSSRFSDADVEGTTGEMQGIAKAIRSRGTFEAYRCSVDATTSDVRFRSPRNSQEDGITDLACADELASLIEKTLPVSS